MELSEKEIKLLLAVIDKSSYTFETAKIAVSLFERLNTILTAKAAEVTKDK